MDQTLASDTSFPVRTHAWRRRAAVAALLVLVVAVLVLTPPLVNGNRFGRRIAASMSASLGRPVHLDSVALHLLPFPGFTLTNLVVSEDPAFGGEPTIRANTVEARLRLSSLWRRKVEFSRVRFVEPSVNLVRNPAGRWNLDSVLVHAAHIDAAPTVQPTAGATPRFPYIEATGARVNVKLGDEKMPFSLTDADFALWLPSSQLWRVRLEGRPLRTDSNVANAGTMRLEGALEGAPRLEQVPAELTASWHDAPLGEATRLLLGRDAGWRGTLNVDATLRGLLGASGISAHVTLNDLRRADFVPSELLDVSAECQAVGNAALAQLSGTECRLRDGGADLVALASPVIDLEHPLTSAARVDAEAVPLAWIFGWVQLLTPRAAAPQAAPQGVASLHFARETGNLWSGAAELRLASPHAPSAVPPAFRWTVGGSALPSARNPLAPAAGAAPGTCGQALLLAPATVHLASGSPLTLSGSVDRCGSVIHASGLASAADLDTAAAALPFLRDGTEPVLPKTQTPEPVDFVCTHTWATPQTCTAQRPSAPAPRTPAARRRRP